MWVYNVFPEKFILLVQSGYSCLWDVPIGHPMGYA